MVGDEEFLISILMISSRCGAARAATLGELGEEATAEGWEKEGRGDGGVGVMAARCLLFSFLRLGKVVLIEKMT